MELQIEYYLENAEKDNNRKKTTTTTTKETKEEVANVHTYPIHY
jgi:hypothetical protein